MKVFIILIFLIFSISQADYVFKNKVKDVSFNVDIKKDTKLNLSYVATIDNITASNTYSSDTPLAVFDGVDGFSGYVSPSYPWNGLTGGAKGRWGWISGWKTIDSATDEWIQIDFNKPIIFTGFKLFGSAWRPTRTPETVKIYVDQGVGLNYVGEFNMNDSRVGEFFLIYEKDNVGSIRFQFDESQGKNIDGVYDQDLDEIGIQEILIYGVEK